MCVGACMGRYKKPADWGLVGDVARTNSVPVIGNGDIITHFEVMTAACVAFLIPSSPT